MQTIGAVLKAYEKQSGAGGLRGASKGMISDAAALMNPEVIQTMRELQKQIRQSFM